MLADKISLKVFMAKTLSEYHAEVDEPQLSRAYAKATELLVNLTYDIARGLEEDNPRFDNHKFIKACFRPRPHGK